ncbi:MAG: hypothetical protein ABI306_00050 [Caulobacteraceae bacterium]
MTIAFKTLLAVALAAATIAPCAAATAGTHHHRHHVAVTVHHRSTNHLTRHHLSRATSHTATRLHRSVKAPAPKQSASSQPVHRHAALCQQVMVHQHWTQHCR